MFAESILRTTSCWRPPNSKKELQHGCIRKWKIDVIDRDRPLKLLPHFYRESMGTSQNPGSLLFTLKYLAFPTDWNVYLILAMLVKQ